ADDIARIDPQTLEVEMIPTPFAGPRRIRFDRIARLNRVWRKTGVDLK
ncbi:MAG: hypothetical protein RLY65_1396, partial [Pseudomonadota bacterium]